MVINRRGKIFRRIICLLAKLQIEGISISSPALSLLEAQKRPVFDYELKALAHILKTDVRWLLTREEKYLEE